MTNNPIRWAMIIAMPIARTLTKCFCLAAFSSFATLAFCQQVKETSVPLGDVLAHALERSSLTGEHEKPFHLKVHIVETTNPPSEYRAEIEEWWVSPQQWRRSIDSPGFKQVIVENGAQSSEQDTGNYLPLWLQEFITAIFNPVPNVDQWNQANARITQIGLANGLHSDACVRAKSRIGSDTVKNDAFSNICFDGAGMLSFYGSPGYNMEFHDYQKFGDKLIARGYQNAPESGTQIVATVTALEGLTNYDPALLTVASSRDSIPTEKGLRSIQVPQNFVGTPHRVSRRSSGLPFTAEIPQGFYRCTSPSTGPVKCARLIRSTRTTRDWRMRPAISS